MVWRTDLDHAVDSLALVEKLLPVLNTESGALRVHKKARLFLNEY
jgi:hypothetical protein